MMRRLWLEVRYDLAGFLMEIGVPDQWLRRWHQEDEGSE